MFEAGKYVVAIEHHPQGWFKKHDIFMCKGVQAGSCTCGEPYIDIGFKANAHSYSCLKCGCRWIDKSTARWFSSTRFLPLDDMVADEEIEEILAIVQDLKIFV